MATDRGPVANLPIPRFVSLKASEGNVRRGPSLSHRIDWVLKRRNMPLQVIGEFGHWRRVRDRDGAGGWVHYSLLSGTRTVIIEENMLPLLMKPDTRAPVNAHAEAGVVARLGECLQDWCRVTADRLPREETAEGLLQGGSSRRQPAGHGRGRAGVTRCPDRPTGRPSRVRKGAAGPAGSASRPNSGVGW